MVGVWGAASRREAGERRARRERVIVMARRLALAGPPGRGPVGPVPVEYAVAVAAFLEQAVLSPASRRVYRISLAGWAWPLVGRPVPAGAERRGAQPPVVPLALLDDVRTAGRLAAAVAERAGATDARTVNRELSALRSAVAWWREQRWITRDPVAGLTHLRAGAVAAPLTGEQVDAVFRVAARLREHTLWRLLYDSSASAADVLALDADAVDLTRHQVR